MAEARCRLLSIINTCTNGTVTDDAPAKERARFPAVFAAVKYGTADTQIPTTEDRILQVAVSGVSAAVSFFFGNFIGNF
jgi:hypothetical protein